MATCPSSQACESAFTPPGLFKLSFPATCLTVTAVGHPGLLVVCADPRQVVPVSPKLDDSDWKRPLKVCGTIGGGLPRSTFRIFTGSPASCRALNLSLWRSTDSTCWRRCVHFEFCSASRTHNYHDNSAAVVFIGTHPVWKSIRRRFTADLHIMMPTLPIIIPFSSLNSRYLSSFFCLFLEKGWRGWAGERNLDSAALIPLSGLVIGVYMIGFYSVPINPCQSKVGLARYQASRDKKSNSSTTVNIP